MAKDERRQNVRVTFRAVTMLKFADCIFKDCETANISVGGVFVRNISGPKKGDACSITFHLVGRSSNLVLEMDGEVVRVTRDGIALQFQEVDDDCFCHLKNIVYYNYKNPEELGEDYYIEDEPENEHVYRGLGLGDAASLVEPYLPDAYEDDLDEDLLSQVGGASKENIVDE